MRSRVIILIFTFFILIAVGMIFHSKSLQENAVQTTGLANAKIFSDAITTFRTLYTSEIVQVASEHGLEITHDYHNKSAIPLPATFSMLVGEKISENETGANSNLYSPYPFPWRQDTGGLIDDFRKKAWSEISKQPNKPYFEFFQGDNNHFLRYAVADKMRSECLSCHNNHPDSPKKDWKLNDLVGILEVTVPLEQTTAKTQSDLIFTIVIYSTLAILGILGILFMVAKHTSEAKELKQAIKLRTSELEDEKTKAINANQAKTDFLSRMSHELRTPLNAILGFAQLLSFDAKNNNEKESCQEILDAGNHLLLLINEILDLSKIETGHLDIDVTEVDVDQVIDDSLKLFKLIAENKGINITKQASSSHLVHADYTRLKQVLVNLISNAIKYNHEDGALEIKVATESSGKTRVYIRDTGIGLNDEQQQKLFMPFERAGAEFSGIDGVGIGLSICKQLINAMDGEIGVNSKPNEGSTFWIELNAV